MLTDCPAVALPPAVLPPIISCLVCCALALDKPSTAPISPVCAVVCLVVIPEVLLIQETTFGSEEKADNRSLCSCSPHQSLIPSYPAYKPRPISPTGSASANAPPAPSNAPPARVEATSPPTSPTSPKYLASFPAP